MGDRRIGGTRRGRRGGSAGWRGAALGAGAVVGGLGLAWAAWRQMSRAYLAPGWPGVKPNWAPADKSGVGTAAGEDGSVWFTVGHGAVTEVFYPRPDRPCTKDLAFVVADGRGFASDERCDADHEVEYLAEGVPAYRVVNACKRGKYRIEKTILAHPGGDVVVQRTRFSALEGEIGDYRLFAVLDPHLGLYVGVNASGWVEEDDEGIVLVARRDDCALALACAPGWVDGSVGYAGTVSDGRLDVLRDGRMGRKYDYAPLGNVHLMGELDPGTCGGEFVVALGFGREPGEAVRAARGAAREDFEGLVRRNAREWEGWQGKLLPLEGVEGGGRDLYRTSAMVLKVHGAKREERGAFVASLSIPWGQAFSDVQKSPGQGGYHMVWPRDLAQVAGGLLAAGAREESVRALEYFRGTQRGDGHWPQNMWVDGVPFWSSLQLGETAAPILLADLLHREGAIGEGEFDGYWPMVRGAIAYIVQHGPSTQEERWEDERGFNAYTIGALIAALLVAGEMAERRGEGREAAFLREVADAWCGSIDYWTYVDGGKLARRVGVPGYYLRVAPPDERGEPAKYGEDLQFWYKKPRVREHYAPAAIVSPDALAYVRFGLRAAEDPRIVATMKVIDAITRTETPEGPVWHRFNHDGYGEKSDGSPFDATTGGHGRGWPLLGLERAHVELAAGRRDEAVRLMRAVERFAGRGGMIPEQVWDTYDIPEHDLYFGRPSGSAMPLAWAHAEYIKLKRSLREGRIFDRPPQTVRRYLEERVESRLVLWRMSHRRRSIPAGSVLRVEVPEAAVVRWEVEGRGGRNEAPTRDSGLGIHYADLGTEGLAPGDAVRFTLEWRGGDVSKERARFAEEPSVVGIGEPADRSGLDEARRSVAADAGVQGENRR